MSSSADATEDRTGCDRTGLRPLLLLLVVAVVAISACGDSATGFEATAEGIDDDRDRFMELGELIIDEERLDPRLVEPVYYCEQVSISLTELMALPIREPATAAELGRTDGPFDLGTDRRWIQLESGNILDSDYLGTDPQGVVIGGSSGELYPCVLLRQSDHPAVAWRIEAVDANRSVVTAAIEPCVSPEDIIVDLRVFGDMALISLFGDPSPGISCIVDGSVTLDIQLPGGVTDIRSAQTWPFVAPDPEVWVTSADVVRAVSPIDERDLAAVRCTATSAIDGSSILWWDVPRGGSVVVVGDGRELFRSPAQDDGRSIDKILRAPFAERLVTYGENSRYAYQDAEYLAGQGDGAFSHFDAPVEPGLTYELLLPIDGSSFTVPCGDAGRLAELPIPDCLVDFVGGKPQMTLVYENGFGPINRVVIRDGEAIDVSVTGGPNPIDTTATPGRSYRYEVELSDNIGNRPPVRADCGTVAIPEPLGGADELLSAGDLFRQVALGAHVYMTVTVQGETHELYMLAGTDGSDWFPPPLDSDPYLNPYTIHERLAPVPDDEREVTYTLDPSSGLPTRWTVDGSTWELHCFEIDTAPPELRIDVACDPTRDLIGS